MSKSLKILRWATVNGIFATLTVYGFALDVQGAKNISAFFIYVLLFLSLFSFNKDLQAAAAKRGFSVPMWLDITFDFAVTSFLLWYGHTWYATLYFIHMIFTAGLRNGVNKLNEQEQTP